MSRPRMSAYECKAVVPTPPFRCPLMTHFGHQAKALATKNVLSTWCFSSGIMVSTVLAGPKPVAREAFREAVDQVSSDKATAKHRTTPLEEHTGALLALQVGSRNGCNNWGLRGQKHLIRRCWTTVVTLGGLLHCPFLAFDGAALRRVGPTEMHTPVDPTHRKS